MGTPSTYMYPFPDKIKTISRQLLDKIYTPIVKTIPARPFAPEESQSRFYVDIGSPFCINMSPNCVYMWIYARPFASQVFLSHFYVEICSFFCIPRVLISFLCRYMFILLHHMGPNLVHVDTCSFFYIR